jgi:hypothetical protein
MEPKYPHINVPLVGEDGNAFFILARCQSAARRGGLDFSEIQAFMKEAQSGDYDNLLQTVCDWFNTDSDEEEWE